MRLLLDTSYLYGLAAAPFAFSAAEKALLSDPLNELFASAVSLWEMRIKFHQRHRSGVRKSEIDPIGVVEMLESHDIALIHFTAEHAGRPLKTAIRHKDPFDEILLVQAQEESLRLLTVDRRLAGHPLAMTL